MEEKEILNCFEPVIDKNCEILILGSMPSKKSREAGFYYGNPTNRFWKILSVIYNEDFVNAGIFKRRELLLKHKIALSDVYSSCEMKKEGSSLDSNIINGKINDVPLMIEKTSIKRIYVTSKKAYDDFIKRFGKYFSEESVKVINLPSPSSANRSVYKTDEELINKWFQLMK